MSKSTSKIPTFTARALGQPLVADEASVDNQPRSDWSRPGDKSLNPRHRPFTEFTPPRVNIDVYPPALAKHEDIVRDRHLFMDTLTKFHGSLGSKMMIPKIGGTYLDLHLLYRVVTARGGLQQVIKNRIWREIKAIFHFPRTATNASFVLRKYYTSLLHHYEQVYFLRAQGQIFSPNAPVPDPYSLSPAPSPTLRSADNNSRPLFSAKTNSEPNPSKKRSRHSNPFQVLSVHPAASIGQMVTGIIDGKFDHGYLVTVLVGSEKLRGVMYNVPPEDESFQYAGFPLCTGNLVFHSGSQGRKIRHHRKRRFTDAFNEDQTAPKFNRSGYNFFFAEQRKSLKGLHPGREKEISRMIGDNWSKLTEEERLPYQLKGQKDKERYQKELSEYHQKIAMRINHLDQGISFKKVVKKQTLQTLEDESEHSDNFYVALNNGTAKKPNMALSQTKLVPGFDVVD